MKKIIIALLLVFSILTAQSKDVFEVYQVQDLNNQEITKIEGTITFDMNRVYVALGTDSVNYYIMNVIQEYGYTEYKLKNNTHYSFLQYIMHKGVVSFTWLVAGERVLIYIRKR